MVDLYSASQNVDGPIEPSEKLNMFSEGQHNAHEYLRWLLQNMHNTYLATVSGINIVLNSPINKIFGGKSKVQLQCIHCQQSSASIEPFHELQLKVNTNTLQDAVDAYFEPQRIEHFCENCKKNASAKKQLILESAPPLLCIKLERFEIDGNKLNKDINVQQFIHLPSDNDTGKKLEYDLVSMVQHYGSTNESHYTTVAKIDMKHRGQWFKFDNANVSQIIEKRKTKTNAYILFYEKINAAIAIDSLFEIPSDVINEIKVDHIEMVSENVFKIKVNRGMSWSKAQELLRANDEVGSGFYFTDRMNKTTGIKEVNKFICTDKRTFIFSA